MTTYLPVAARVTALRMASRPGGESDSATIPLHWPELYEPSNC